MDTNLVSNLLFIDLLDYMKKTPYDNIVFNIGSAPRTHDLDTFNADMDQLLPVFLLELIKNTDKSFRVIHCDPAFNYAGCSEFLTKYFKSKGYKCSITSDYTIWNSDRVEVIIISTLFISDHRWVLENLIRETVINKRHMIVQQYNGPELLPLFAMILENKPNRSEILKYVLFDITYGMDCHCMTPMTKYSPILDRNGDFVNVTFYDEEESISIIGMNPRIDEIIKTRFVKEFSKILNDNHVNYRTAIRGEGHKFPSTLYADNAPAPQIMKILLHELSKNMRVLDKLNYLTPEKYNIFNIYSQNYDTTDLYKWYCEMAKICK